MVGASRLASLPHTAHVHGKAVRGVSRRLHGGHNHAKDIRGYEITSKGVVILGKRLANYQSLISGLPIHCDRPEAAEELSE
jgi:hypothetical protein